jgi:hypothetical protein
VGAVGLVGDTSGSQAYVDATGANPVKFTTHAVCFK